MKSATGMKRWNHWSGSQKKRSDLVVVITIISKNIVTTYCRAIVAGEIVNIRIPPSKIFNTTYKRSTVTDNNKKKEEKRRKKKNEIERFARNFEEYYKISKNTNICLFISM